VNEGPTDLSALSFEELVEELERLTRQMAAGDIGIEMVADLYEQAGRLHAEAAQRLETVRERIERLSSGPHPGSGPSRQPGLGPTGSQSAGPRPTEMRPRAPGAQEPRSGP